MLWFLLGLGILFTILLFVKTIKFTFRVFFGIAGPVLLIAMLVLLALGIMF